MQFKRPCPRAARLRICEAFISMALLAALPVTAGTPLSDTGKTDLARGRATNLSSRTVEEQGGQNLYGFVANDAIDRTDPLGLT